MKTIKLLGIGVAGWIAGILLLFLVGPRDPKIDSTSAKMLWVLEHWWAAFALGLLIMLAAALKTRAKPQQALMAYAGPVILLAVVAGICLLIYPDASFREELAGYLPVAIIFYVFGCVWAATRKEEQGTLARAMLPPLVGGFLILFFVALPVFTSNAFRYRNAFDLAVRKFEKTAGMMSAQCVLEIRKPGDYQFTAPGDYLFEMMIMGDMDDQQIPPGKLIWGEAGAPGNGATGKFPVEIRWENLPKVSPEIADLQAYEPPVYLEIRRADKPEEIIYTLTGSAPQTQ